MEDSSSGGSAKAGWALRIDDATEARRDKPDLPIVDEAPPPLRAKLYEFCSETSFHGVDLIRAGQSRVAVAFWIACALLGNVTAVVPSNGC